MKKDSQIAASYLSEYSDTVEVLPLELQRNYTLIRQLDESFEEIMAQVAAEAKAVSTKTLSADLIQEEKRAKLLHLGQLLNEALKKGEEKFALAKSTYDTVDRHCTRLDNDLQKIEDEQLIGPGRVGSNNASATTTPTTSTNTAAASAHHQKRLAISAAASTSPTTAANKRRRRESIDEIQKVAGGGSGGRGNRKRSRKDNKQAHADYLSTHDAIQHAKNSVSLSEFPIDPNEPLYCYCSQVSYGEMVACDNDECEIEWFHLECVGLKIPPKGKWYCKNCTMDLQKKKKKH